MTAWEMGAGSVQLLEGLQWPLQHGLGCTQSVGNTGEAREEIQVFLSNLQCTGAHPRPVPFTREGAELFTAIPVPTE